VFIRQSEKVTEGSIFVLSGKIRTFFPIFPKRQRTTNEATIGAEQWRAMAKDEQTGKNESIGAIRRSP